MEGISSRQNVAQTNHNQADSCAWGTICGPFAIKHETDDRGNSSNVDLSRTGMTCTFKCITGKLENGLSEYGQNRNV